MSQFKEELKDAICNNDLSFLQKNRDKYNIDERFEDEDNDTLLLYSISDQESFMYRYFLENGADVSPTNDEGENILHAINFSGDEQRLIEILENFKVDINRADNEWTTPLSWAISLKQWNLARILIEHDADVNKANNEGFAPIYLATQGGDLEIVTLIINRGANLKVKTEKGNYPLALAVYENHENIIKYLFF